MTSIADCPTRSTKLKSSTRPKSSTRCFAARSSVTAKRLLTPLTATGLKPHFLEKLAANNVVLPPAFFNPEEVDVRAAFSVNGYGGAE